jgi:predicted nuclease of predicted toxin-antitoxin system
MKFKLDENLGGTAARFLEDAGCDVSTVRLQNLWGTADRNLIEVCASEGRCLVTLDLDFSNPLQFPPEHYAGIIVLRLPKQPSGEDIINCLRTLRCCACWSRLIRQPAYCEQRPGPRVWQRAVDL